MNAKARAAGGWFGALFGWSRGPATASPIPPGLAEAVRDEVASIAWSARVDPLLRSGHTARDTGLERSAEVCRAAEARRCAPA